MMMMIMMICSKRKGMSVLKDSFCIDEAASNSWEDLWKQTNPVISCTSTVDIPTVPLCHRYCWNISPRWLNTSEFFCVGYSSSLTWILKCKAPPSVSLTLSYYHPEEWMSFFYYITQSYEPLHNFTIVSYFAVFSIGLWKKTPIFFFYLEEWEDWEKEPYFHILLKKNSACCLWMQSSFTHMTQLEGNAVFTETSHCREKVIKKKEMTSQRKYHVYSLNSSSKK